MPIGGVTKTAAIEETSFAYSDPSFSFSEIPFPDLSLAFKSTKAISIEKGREEVK